MKNYVRDAIFMIFGIVLISILIMASVSAIIIFGVISILSLFARLKRIDV